MANCLYTTVLTDTGGFCYGSVRESTFALARELVRPARIPSPLRRRCISPRPPPSFCCWARRCAGSNAKETWRGYGSHMMTWSALRHRGRLRRHCEFALGIAGVDAAVFLRELPEGRIRVSLRSKGGVNVAAIAARSAAAATKTPRVAPSMDRCRAHSKRFSRSCAPRWLNLKPAIVLVEVAASIALCP